jgi:hypothetical protein
MFIPANLITAQTGLTCFTNQDMILEYEIAAGLTRRFYFGFASPFFNLIRDSGARETSMIMQTITI